MLCIRYKTHTQRVPEYCFNGHVRIQRLQNLEMLTYWTSKRQLADESPASIRSNMVVSNVFAGLMLKTFGPLVVFAGATRTALETSLGSVVWWDPGLVSCSSEQLPSVGDLPSAISSWLPAAHESAGRVSVCSSSSIGVGLVSEDLDWALDVFPLIFWTAGFLFLVVGVFLLDVFGLMDLIVGGSCSGSPARMILLLAFKIGIQQA